jgi:methylated-DNA-[protein]-cysteine S-methyltransferase
MFYQLIKVGKEEIGLVWRDAAGKPLVESIYLPGGRGKMKSRMVRDFPAIHMTARVIPDGIDQLIADLYNGKKQHFNLSRLNLSRLTEFSAGVLKLTYKIPRGKVDTYSGLAAKAGSPRAARAVGAVMANNPFPIVIPCHRVVQAGGRIGQFGGGSDMKKQLLAREGIVLDLRGRVSVKQIRH